MHGVSDPDDRLRELLLRHRLVTPAQLEDAEALRQSRGRADPRPRLLDVLVSQGVLPGADVVRGLSARAAPPPQTLPDETAPPSLWGPLPPDVEAAAADPDRRFGKYVLVREAGRGATGIVWRAWDRVLSRAVALKLLLPHAPEGLDTGFAAGEVEDFLREARTAARLQHPNIVRVYEVGRIRNRYYLSMDFVGGTTLSGLIHAGRTGRRTRFATRPQMFLSVLEDVARAIHHAHRQSPPVVHRDLKPGNILIDASGQPFVADFGLAREVRVERRNDGRGPVKGTPQYMAPEQAEGRLADIDARTDVYGMGAVLYEVLCGFPPFVDSSIPSLLRQVTAGAVEPPSRKIERLLSLRKDAFVPARTIPPALEAVCLKALSARKEDRYPSALAFAEALREARQSFCSPPTARPRRPVVLAATAALLLAAGAAWHFGAAGREATEPRADAPASEPPPAERDDETATWALAVLRKDLLREASALAADGPGPAWGEEPTKARARRLMERADVLLSSEETPFEPDSRLREARDTLAAVVAWTGTWSLRVNVAPFAEVVVREHGRVLARGWTPLGLPALPVGSGSAEVELYWPSEARPRVRVVRPLSALRHGHEAVISGDMEREDVSVAGVSR